MAGQPIYSMVRNIKCRLGHKIKDSPTKHPVYLKSPTVWWSHSAETEGRVPQFLFLHLCIQSAFSNDLTPCRPFHHCRHCVIRPDVIELNGQMKCAPRMRFFAELREGETWNRLTVRHHSWRIHGSYWHIVLTLLSDWYKLVWQSSCKGVNCIHVVCSRWRLEPGDVQS